jgi:hypothetical protein
MSVYFSTLSIQRFVPGEWGYATSLSIPGHLKLPESVDVRSVGFSHSVTSVYVP